jgi:hypothetical protein
MLYRRYRIACRRQMPLDEAKLGYYLAWAAFRRLCRFGVWFRAGPPVTGSKPSGLRHLQPRRVDVLRRCFLEQTGITVALPPDSAARRWSGQPGIAY